MVPTRRYCYPSKSAHGSQHSSDKPPNDATAMLCRRVFISHSMHRLKGARLTMTQKKILIVDDDPEMRLALHIRLKANNYDVAVAVDGVSGIAETRKHMPDLILLDLGLPAGDGFTVLERLSINDSLAHIPVIVVSGRDRAANRDRALKAGAKIFLQKPVKNAELLYAIEQTLGMKTSAHPWSTTSAATHPPTKTPCASSQLNTPEYSISVAAPYHPAAAWRISELQKLIEPILTSEYSPRRALYMAHPMAALDECRLRPLRGAVVCAVLLWPLLAHRKIERHSVN